MRIAFFSPLPPVPSGISEYSEDLLPYLARYVDVDLFVEREGVGAALAGRFPLYTAERFPERASLYDVPVYQMGNNVHHLYMYRTIKEHPGILVLHDAVLHHFYIESTLARGDRQSYIDHLTRAYGEAGRVVAMNRVDGYHSDAQFFLFPMNEELSLSSRAVIVHNEPARRELLRSFPRLVVETVPMGIPAPAEELPTRAESRAALGIPSDAFVIGSFGFVTRIKRIHVVLRAVAAALARIPKIFVLVIGEASPGLGLEDLARSLGIADRVRLAGYVGRDDVKAHLGAVDVFVNLRYPTAGETSASLLKLMAHGKPVIVSAFRQFWDLPDSVCPKVRPGSREAETLTGHLIRMADEPEALAAYGLAAKRHVAERHGMEAAATGYARLIERVVRERIREPGLPAETPWVRVPWRTSRFGGTVKGTISCAGFPSSSASREKLCLDVHVENLGNVTWLRAFSRLGGFVTLAAFLVADDGSKRMTASAALPRDIAPGEGADLILSMTSPAEPGTHRFMIDLVVEGRGWFHFMGWSEPIEFVLEVAARGAGSAAVETS